MVSARLRVSSQVVMTISSPDSVFPSGGGKGHIHERTLVGTFAGRGRC